MHSLTSFFCQHQQHQ